MPDPSQVIEYQTGFAPQLAPYAENMLGQAQALTDTSQNPYMQYMGDKFAQFTPLQQQAFQGAQGMQAAPELGQATGLAGLASQAAMNYGTYQPASVQNAYAATQAYNPMDTNSAYAATQAYAPRAAQNAYNPTQAYTPTQFNAYLLNNPDLQQYQMGNAADVSSGDPITATKISAAKSSYNPTLKDFSMGEADKVSANKFTAPGSAAAYMSPYMQNVVEQQQRNAQRSADIATTTRHSDQTKQGAFGGSRGAVMDAEAARNLAQQKGDIQTAGSQAAYQQAQSQFNADQQASLASQQANQQAGITVGQQNLNAKLGIQQLGAGQNMQAQLANQQALQAAQQQAEQSKQFGAGQAMTNAQQQAQYGQAAQAQAEQSSQFSASNALTNAQMQAQYGQAAQAQAEQARQFSANQAMTNAQQQAQYGQSAQQLAEQSRQYGAGLGLQGLQTALTGAGQLGSLGQNTYQQNMGINQLQQQYGAQQQQQVQNILGSQYQDYLNNQNYPYKQLGFMSDMLKGLPLSQTSSTMYQAAPSTMSQVAGLGTAAYGLSKMAGAAKGGSTKDIRKRGAGLAELALARMA
jgi:hypothetical protein